MNNTKQKILDCAIKLFSKKGFGAVTLFEIAGELEISRGNITYHFKTKDIILDVIAEQMWEKIMKERNKSRQLPSFENLHNEIQLYQKLQKRYAFIFNDSHVIKHPLLKKKLKTMVDQTVKDCEAAIAFAINKGNVKPEPFKGVYHNLAINTWMVSFFWPSQKAIRGDLKSESPESIIWSMLIPHFTEKGIIAFESFFGQDYIENLGVKFEANIENFINF